MSEHKTVKEVCQLTGLSRKLLHDYDVQNIVKPSKYKNIGYLDRDGKEYDGYKLYDQEAVVKLQQIAIFRKLRLKRAEIKKRMTVNYDSNKVLEEQIIMLQKEKEEIEALLIVANQLKMIGMENDISGYYALFDMGELAKDIKRWDTISCYQELFTEFERNLDKDNWEIEKIIEELVLIKEDEYGSLKAMNIIKRLFAICLNQFGIIGWIIIWTLSLSEEGKGQLAREFNESIGDDSLEVPFKAISIYIKKDLRRFNMALDEVQERYYDITNYDISDEKAKQMVEELKNLLKKHFGIRNKLEYEFLIEMFENRTFYDEDGYIEYVLKAIKYHCI